MKTLLIAYIIAVVLALNEAAPGKKTLVIMESMEYLNTHSLFISNLSDNGFDVSLTSIDGTFEISKYGVYNYDNIVMMLSSPKKYESLKNKEFRSFIDFHGSVFVMFANSPSDFLRNFAGYNGVEIDIKDSTVVDHFTATIEQGNQAHTKFTSSKYLKNSRLVGDLASYSGSILYHGLGMRVDENNVLAIRVLTGDIATTSLSPTGIAQRHSSSVVLIAAIQTRNNNRIIISGSLDMFSNAYYLQNHDNQLLGNQLSLWTFKSVGYLRVSNIQHFKYNRVDETIDQEHEILVQTVHKRNLPISHYAEPEVAGNNVVYRVKDDLYYSVLVEEWTGIQWTKYQANDLQIELVMLDPYVRKYLSFIDSSDEADYSTIIKAPDVYGIFKFRLFYQRQGVSLINENTQVSIRPFKHTEFPRFILAAYPYYMTALVVMIAFSIFVFVFLFIGEKHKQE